MNISRPVFLLALACLAISGGCTKEKEKKYGFRMKIDGIEKIYEDRSDVTYGTSTAQYHLNIAAISEEIGLAKIDVVSTTDIRPGSYVWKGVNADQIASIMFQADGEFPYGFSSLLESDDPFQVTITAISDEYVSGTFKGKIEKNGVIRTVSNGWFGLNLR